MSILSNTIPVAPFPISLTVHVHDKSGPYLVLSSSEDEGPYISDLFCDESWTQVHIFVRAVDVVHVKPSVRSGEFVSNSRQIPEGLIDRLFFRPLTGAKRDLRTNWAVLPSFYDIPD